MKRIEDIEKLGVDELERIADQSEVQAPSELTGRIEDVMCAERLARKHGQTGVRKFVWIPAVAAVAAALFVGIRYENINAVPKDTFDDPREAYAEIERAFGAISEKVNKGKSIADASLSQLNKSSELVDKFYN